MDFWKEAISLSERADALMDEFRRSAKILDPDHIDATALRQACFELAKAEAEDRDFHDRYLLNVPCFLRRQAG